MSEPRSARPGRSRLTEHRGDLGATGSLVGVAVTVGLVGVAVTVGLVALGLCVGTRVFRRESA